MQLRWGICSAAKICNDFCVALKTLPGNVLQLLEHCPQISTVLPLANFDILAENHKIQAVAARSKDSAQKLADAFDIETVYEGYDGLANDQNVNIVYIGSINSAHYDL